MEKYKVSVATACYKSEAFIERTFQSLMQQHYENLEWNVVVDGNTDATASLLETFRARAPFPINITVFASSRGATPAIGAAIQMCSGDFTTILDHDDELMPDAIGPLLQTWDRVTSAENRETIYAVVGRCVDENGIFIGRRLSPPVLVTTLGHFHFVKKCQGECAGLARTDILKRYYRFSPEDFGSTNGLIWNRLNRDYRAIFTNLVLRRYHTDVVGSMSNTRAIKRPAALANQELESLNDNARYFPFAPLTFLKKLAMYERYSRHAKQGFLKPVLALKGPRLKAAAICMWPAALWLAWKDQRSGRIS